MAEVFAPFLVSAGNILTFVFTTASIGTFVWRAAVWMNNKSIEKTEKLAAEAAARSDALKQQAEDIANSIREKTDMNERTLTEKISAMENWQRTTYDERHNALIEQMSVLKNQFGSIQSQYQETMTAQTKGLEAQAQLISDVRHKSDMTNGNVAKILTELSNISEDNDDLYEQIQSLKSGDGKEINERIRKRKRSRRIDRHRIERDRISQNEY